MRRLPLPHRQFSFCIPRWCSSDSILNDLFSELSACDITQRSGLSKASGVLSTSSSSPPSVAASRPPCDAEPAPEDTAIRAELAKQDHLQRLLHEAKGQAAMANSEEKRTEETRRFGRYVVSPPAALHLSTAELIQEKSPQHFTSAEDSEARLAALPRPTAPGSVAVVTLVGRVLEEPTAHGSDENTDSNAADVSGEDAPHTRFLVQYNVPFLSSAKPVSVQVRCYGATLSCFAQRHIKTGDLVHVLGHVLPLFCLTAGGPAFCVCALPVGGNISVVLPAQMDSAT